MNKHERLRRSVDCIVYKGMSVSETAEELGVTTRTIQNYMADEEWETARDYVSFEKYNQFYGRAMIVVERALYNDENPDPALAKWVLERLAPTLSGSKAERTAARDRTIEFGSHLGEDEKVVLDYEDVSTEELREKVASKNKRIRTTG